MAEPAASLLHLEPPLDHGTLIALFEAFPHDVGVVDDHGVLVAANRRWLSATTDPLLGHRVGDRVINHAAAVTETATSIAEHLDDGLTRVLRGRAPRFELQYEIRTPDTTHWFLVAAVGLPDGGAVVTHTDTTIHHSVQDVLAEMAFHDTLTGLPNRTLVIDRIRTALVRAQRTAAFPAVMFVDLDGFKAVNDRYGHGVGDAVLVAASERLTSAVREGDTCGRWGGDEFVLVIDITNPSTVEGLIRRTRRAFAAPFEVDGTEIAVGLSIGVVVSQASDAVDDLIRRADGAMYEAKRSGSGVIVYGADQQRQPQDTVVLHLP